MAANTLSLDVWLLKEQLELVSSGVLPTRMTDADLWLMSIPRNPLLFAILQRMEEMEHIESGIKRIRNLCREYGVAEPEIDVSAPSLMRYAKLLKMSPKKSSRTVFISAVTWTGCSR